MARGFPHWKAAESAQRDSNPRLSACPIGPRLPLRSRLRGQYLSLSGSNPTMALTPQPIALILGGAADWRSVQPYQAPYAVRVTISFLRSHFSINRSSAVTLPSTR